MSQNPWWFGFPQSFTHRKPSNWGYSYSNQAWWHHLALKLVISLTISLVVGVLQVNLKKDTTNIKERQNKGLHGQKTRSSLAWDKSTVHLKDQRFSCATQIITNKQPEPLSHNSIQSQKTTDKFMRDIHNPGPTRRPGNRPEKSCIWTDNNTKNILLTARAAWQRLTSGYIIVSLSNCCLL